MRNVGYMISYEEEEQTLNKFVYFLRVLPADFVIDDAVCDLSQMTHVTLAMTSSLCSADKVNKHIIPISLITMCIY